MVQFANVVIGYFIVGAVMWGGGAIAWDDAGVATLFIDDPQTGATDKETARQLEQSGGPIQQASQSVSGGLIAVWNLLIKLVGYLFWPIVTVAGANAPPSVIVLVGGTPTVAFYTSIIRVFRGT